MSASPRFTVAAVPRYRMGTLDFFHYLPPRPVIHGLIEVDITDVLRTIHEYEARTGEDISFVAFTAYCLARAIEADKAVGAFRVGRKLIIYDDIDVNVMVEREVDGHKVVGNHILRAANRKGVPEMCAEIRTAQTQSVRKTRSINMMRWYARLPGFVRALMLRYLQSHTHLWKELGGTTGITSVGMFGEGAGWGIPMALVGLMLTLGGIGKKPGIVEERIEIRDYLCITVSFDHTITDGAPAARFVNRLQALVESGAGLEFCHPARKD